MYIPKAKTSKIKNPFNFLIAIIIKINNIIYIHNQLKKNKKFFDNINGHSLDKTQRKIIVSEEDSTLIIAPAGSGKSLTIIGKILYLLKNKIDPKDILVLSFTNEASNKLKENLKKYNIKMDILTFHKLGRRILKNNNLSVNLISENILKKIIIQNIYKYDNLHIMLKEEDVIKFKYENLSNSKEIDRLKKVLFTFINLFKSGNYKLKDFDFFLRQNEHEESYTHDKNKAFLNLAKKIYLDYNYYLEKNKQIDFHDMINKAIDIVKEKNIYDYKYIIIDEYQDTSLVKCELIQAIKNKTKSKLLAVGDDFQSIYRFTGTNLKVFLNFSQYFPYSKIFKLQKTYRNSKELITIVNKFILKNKKQIFKNIYSDKTIKNPIIIIYYNKTIFEVLEKIIKSIGEENVLILGRNNKDLIGINYKCMTIHKSKGLEAENTIIIGLEDKIDGLPNKIINDPVLKYVLDDKDQYLYEEERRLFYVALTRTKNTNYLLVNKNKPSIFIKELIKDNPNIKILK